MAVRLVAPVLILRWPLGGMLVSIAADYLDVVIVAAIQRGTFDDYTSLDKLLDIYALGYAASVSLSWKNAMARNTSLSLFGYRLVGVLVLALTGSRWVLFVFPNVFEFFYLYHLATMKWSRWPEIDNRHRLIIVVGLLTLMKSAQEFALHVEFFDSLGYLRGAAILTALCCLPTGIASITYAVLHRLKVKSGNAAMAAWSAERAKMLTYITAAIASGFSLFWIGLASLNLIVGYGIVFS